MAKETTAAAVMSIAGMTVSAFATFAPKVTELRRANTGDETERDLRVGEMVAVAYVIGTAVVASAMTDNWSIAIIAALASAAFLTIYEGVLEGS